MVEFSVKEKMRIREGFIYCKVIVCYYINNWNEIKWLL